jgi:peptide-methionine (S)-S-oxide reductase
MYKYFVLIAVIFLIVATMVACSAATASVTAIPDPALDAPLASSKGVQTAVLAGGCFWGVENRDPSRRASIFQ